MTPTASTPPPARFHGWHRQGRRDRWALVVSADDEIECWRLLREARQGGDFCVLETGKAPWEPYGGRRAR